MEALGIGRPSTFATITALLQARLFIMYCYRLWISVDSRIRPKDETDILSSAARASLVCVFGPSVPALRRLSVYSHDGEQA